MNAIQIPYDQNFDKRCKFAAEAGFKSISVNFNDAPDPSDLTYDKAPAHIMDILEQYDLKVVQTHLYYYYPLLSAEKTDDALEHRVLREIEVSGKIGAKWCAWHTRYYLAGDWNDGNYDEEKTLYYNQKTVPIYLAQAARFGTGIALENLFGNMIWGGTRMLARLCDSFSVENVGICWDTGHANIMEFEQSQDEAIRFLGKRIKCTHIHNNYQNMMDFHLTPDLGNIKWERVMNAFKDIEYKGPFTLETLCPYQYDEQLVRDFYNHNFNCMKFLQRISEM